MFRPSKRIEGAHRDGIWSVFWSKTKIATGSLDGTLKLWKEDLSLCGTTPEQRLGISSVVLLNDSEAIVSCCQDSIIRFFDIPGLKQYGEIDPGHLEAYSISLSRSNDMLAAGSHSGKIHIWSAGNQTEVSTMEAGCKYILSTSFNDDGTKLAGSNINGALYVFDVHTNQIIHKIDAHGMPIRRVTFSKDGNLIYTASDDRHVTVFDAKNGSIVNSFSHSGMAFCVDVSPDNRHFVVGCADHTVALWDLGMQRQEQIFEAQHNDQVWGVAFDESGNRFVSVGDDALLQMYERSVL